MQDVLSAFDPPGRATSRNKSPTLAQSNQLNRTREFDKDLDLLLTKPNTASLDKDRASLAVDRFKTTARPANPQKTQTFANAYNTNEDDLLALISNQPDSRTYEKSRRTSLDPSGSARCC